MPYLDPVQIDDPRTGHLAPSAWGDQVRDNLEFLIERPMCNVLGSAYRSITSGGSWPLTQSTERFDTDGMHSTTTNNSRITIQTAGLYYVYGTVVYQSAAGGYRKVQFLYNGSVTDEVQVVRGEAGFETTVSGSVLFPFVVGDYIVMHASHNAGSNLDCISTDFGAFLMRPV